jgi:FkbM family methyltransferase
MNKVLTIYAYIFSRKLFFKWNYFLFHVGLRGMGVLNYTNFIVSGEKFLINFLKKNYSLDLVMDVGANDGDYTAFYMDYSTQIYCFEPHPNTSRKLTERFKGNDKIKVIPKGLSNTQTKTVIYDYAQDNGSSHASLYAEVITDIHNSKMVEVRIELDTLNSVAQELSIEHINLLKIDTEGNEYKCLLGASDLLDNGRVDVIHFEFNEMNVYSGVFMKDFVELLPNYNLYRLLPSGFLPITYKSHRPLRYEVFAFQNIVAFRKDIDTLVR